MSRPLADCLIERLPPSRGITQPNSKGRVPRSSAREQNIFNTAQIGAKIRLNEARRIIAEDRRAADRLAEEIADTSKIEQEVTVTTFAGYQQEIGFTVGEGGRGLDAG